MHLLLLSLFDLMVCLLLILKAQSDKQNRAVEEQLNDQKYQVREETINGLRRLHRTICVNLLIIQLLTR